MKNYLTKQSEFYLRIFRDLTVIKPTIISKNANMFALECIVATMKSAGEITH